MRRAARALLFLCLPSVVALGWAADYGKVTTEKVADGVYLFTTSRYGDVGFGGNVVAVLSSDGVAVFDTGGTPATAQTILQEIRKLTDNPVRFVINSHWHWDHWGGNQVFSAAFPGVPIVSHDKNRDQMIHVAVPWNAPGLERDLPGYIAGLQKKLAESEAKGAPAEEIARQRELLQADQDFLQQKKSVTYTFPNLTFSDRATLFLGERELQVLHSRAITPGDTYAYLPKDKILITGDIVVYPIPFAVGGSYPSEWIATLQRLIALQPAIVIPGHGGAQRDLHYVKANLQLFQRVLSDVKEAKASGLTLQQAKEKLGSRARDYAAMLSLGSEALNTFKGYFLDVFITRAYRELEHPLGDEPTS